MQTTLRLEAHRGWPALERGAQQPQVLASGELLAQLGDPYSRVGVDSTGRTAIDFGVYGVPETYVLDKTGRIRYRQVGPITQEDYDGKILPLLKRLTAS